MTSSTIEVRGLGEDDVTCSGVGGIGRDGCGGTGGWYKEAGCVWVGTKVRSVTGRWWKGKERVCVCGCVWYTHRCCP